MNSRAAWIPLALAAACGDGVKTDNPDGGPVRSVRLTQAIGGALWVNPDAYAVIPVRAIVDGDAAAVTISIDGVATPAERTGDTWTARVPVAALASGEHELVADADGVRATATLGVGREGIQWTSIAVDRNAATPRLHRVDDRLVLTWTAFAPSGERVAWLQELDGAGRGIGERVALVGGTGEEDVLYARAAHGGTTLGLVFQQRGGPYANFFTIVGSDGSERVAPIALDPADRFGSYSGDVVYTGTGYDVVWRTNDGMGGSDVRWMHVDAASGAVTGPVIAAAKGAGDPHAGFDPFTNVSVRHHAGASLIAFSRYFHDATLDLELLRCQLATVVDGVATTELVAAGSGWFWDDDCRIVDDGASPVVIRAGKDLASSEDNPPDLLFAARVPLAGDRGDGRAIVSAPETRVEPTMIGTAAAPILAWSDARSYAIDLAQGQVELYAAVLGPDLVAGEHVRFAHSRFIEGTADIRGVAAGENAIVTWIDERHGGSVIDPKPEVYLETIWQ